MVDGPNGRLGRDVVSRVVEEHRLGPEHVPIHRHNMAAMTALEKTKKCDLAMNSHVQVNTLRFYSVSLIWVF